MSWFKKLFGKEEEYVDIDLCNMIDDKFGLSRSNDILTVDIANYYVNGIQIKEGNNPCFNTGWKINNFYRWYDDDNVSWVELHPYCQNCCWNKWCK
jgi:hypothetical protein